MEPKFEPILNPVLEAISRPYMRTDPSMYDQFATEVYQEKPKRHSGIVKCPHCEYTTHRISILKRHLLVHKKPGECQMYKCPHCSYETKYKGQLPNHIIHRHLREEPRKRPGPPKAKRKSQQKTSRRRSRTSNSSQSESDEEIYKEESDSQQSFDSSKHFNKPIANEDQITTEDFKECKVETNEEKADEKPPQNEDEDFNIKPKIIQEPTTKPQYHSFRCSECDFKGIRRSHVYKHVTSQKLTKSKHKNKAQLILCCNLCKFEHTDDNIFRNHIKSHEKQNKQTVWLCEKCSHVANSRRNLREHDIRHHRPKPERVFIKCTYCDYRSFWRDAVKKHIEMTHTNPENVTTYICDICAHQTKYKNNFKRHMATHRDLTKLSEAEKYTCKICYFETPDKYTYKKHLKKQKCSIETAEDMLKCPDCNFRAWHKGDIKKHSIIHNKSIPHKQFTCQLCQYTSRFKRDAVRHVKTAHHRELEGRKRLPKNIILETTIEVPKEVLDHAHERAMAYEDNWKHSLWNPAGDQKSCGEPKIYVEPQNQAHLEPQTQAHLKPQTQAHLEPQTQVHLESQPQICPEPSFQEPIEKTNLSPHTTFELSFENLIHGTDFNPDPKNDEEPPPKESLTIIVENSEEIKEDTYSNALTPHPSSFDSDTEEKGKEYFELQTPNPVFDSETKAEQETLWSAEDEKPNTETNDKSLEIVKEDFDWDEEDNIVLKDLKARLVESNYCEENPKKEKKKRKVKKDSEQIKKPRKEPVSKSAIGQARYNRSFKCSLPECVYQNVHRSMVVRHMKIHHKNGQLEADIVQVDGVRFNSMSSKNLMKKSYKCSACGYKHLVRTMVRRHQETHLKRNETNLQILMACESCDFEHVEQYVLRKHYLMEHRILKCQVCPFQTKTRKELQDHLTAHRKKQELEMNCCEICGFKTPWRDSLKKHMLTHQAKEEAIWYCCEVCAFQTKHKNNLKEHLLTHKDRTEVETYRCPHCEFDTKHKWRLKKHLRLKCNPEGCEMRFKCEHCNFKAYNMADVEKHAKSHVDEDMFLCTICDYKTIVKRNFKRHVLVTHQ